MILVEHSVNHTNSLNPTILRCLFQHVYRKCGLAEKGAPDELGVGKDSKVFEVICEAQQLY